MRLIALYIEGDMKVLVISCYNPTSSAMIYVSACSLLVHDLHILVETAAVSTTNAPVTLGTKCPLSLAFDFKMVLFSVRGKIYELLVNCIPPEIILKKLLSELLKKLDSELKLEVCHWAAYYVSIFSTQTIIAVKRVHDVSCFPFTKQLSIFGMRWCSMSACALLAARFSLLKDSDDNSFCILTCISTLAFHCCATKGTQDATWTKGHIPHRRKRHKELFLHSVSEDEAPRKSLANSELIADAKVDFV
ncbi:hypothetical protein ZIOFF_062382 [Zingiber officinale]|uniref:Uncharacterized protein n=1 Tax=Zingiber officinale TaxID=94328 RepID=A0A8J5KFB3_ZINOF|nr:hypothetical protein ZIOFF_062382 [Zingiber officinale]